jgi:hypothetical protein
MKGYIKLDAERFKERNLIVNMNRLSQDTHISYPSILKYVNRGQNDYDVKTFSGEVLFAILTTGLGFTPLELLDMTFGDIFDIVEGDEVPS